MIEPRSADENVLATLAQARASIEGGDFDSAARIYLPLLDADLAAPLRGEVLTNMGAALCMLARDQQGAAAQAQLDRARDLLVQALPLRQRAQTPVAWATTRANLAVVYLSRYKTTGNSDELLSAHLALDGITQALHDSDETVLRDWVGAIRDQLLELRERRNRPR